MLNHNKSSIPPLFHGSEVGTSPLDKANLFSNRFVSNSTLDDQGHPFPHFPSCPDSDIPVPFITPKKVARNIRTLDDSKVICPVGIPVIVLKMCFPQLSSILAKRYNLCLSALVFPSSWKAASVVPVFKCAGEYSEQVTIAPSDCFL